MVFHANGIFVCDQSSMTTLSDEEINLKSLNTEDSVLH